MTIRFASMLYEPEVMYPLNYQRSVMSFKEGCSPNRKAGYVG
ncbi:hypothetical protein [Edaphobacter sp. 12200R-103]|nr:hypothetical protein [Edaphobacter sp. 12200R-103]